MHATWLVMLLILVSHVSTNYVHVELDQHVNVDHHHGEGEEHHEECEESEIWIKPIPDGRKCNRTCVEGEKMTCGFNFSIQDYLTLSRACYSCPQNISDCSRPQCIPVDGISRVFLAMNRELPGPAIEVCEGDRVVVDVYNGQLSDVETIHWHGQTMQGYQFMDGVPFVTQCPILPHGPFRYDFTAGDAVGTDFWHTHSGLHRGGGIYGAFIVRQVDDPQAHLYDYDRNTLILQDWFHKTLLTTFIELTQGTIKFPDVDSILINGKGRNMQAEAQGLPVYLIPLEVVHVTQGQRYRLRIIDAGVSSCPITISVDDHTMTVIATDAENIEPVIVDSLGILPGERYDVVIDANQPIDNYWIRFRGTLSCSKFKCIQGAILRYEGASDDDPTPALNYSYIRPGLVLNPFDAVEGPDVLPVVDLNSLEPYTLPKHFDKRFFLEFSFNSVNNTAYYSTEYYPYNAVNEHFQYNSPQINNITFEFPSSPLMTQPCEPQPTVCVHGHDHSDHCHGDFCICTQVFEVDLGDMVEMVLVNPFFGVHPFHLHGYSFSVVAMGIIPGYFPPPPPTRLPLYVVKELVESGNIDYKLDDAVLKDTVIIPQWGYTIIRFRADNPGFWLMHCHVLLHSEAGMLAVLHVGKPCDLPPIPKGFPKCHKFVPRVP